MTWRARLGCLLVVGVVGGATGCSPDADPATADADFTTTTAAPGPDADDRWEAIDDRLAALGPQVGFLAAEVSPDGRCDSVHMSDANTARPMAAQAQLFVLGALADGVAGNRIVWDQTLFVEDDLKSVGNTPGSGSLQFAPDGTIVTVGEAAIKMMSVDDNTAADMLIRLLGPDAIQVQIARWMADPTRNDPFLTTRQVTLLHYVPGLGGEYLDTPPAERPGFLVERVDPAPLREVEAGYTVDPRLIEQIEWFGSPADVCRAFSGLLALTERPALADVVPAMMTLEDGGLDLDDSDWPTVWFKGGSEPGVLTMGWLATDTDGDTVVVQAMISDPDAALPTSSASDLVAIAADAFDLLAA